MAEAICEMMDSAAGRHFEANVLNLLRRHVKRPFRAAVSLDSRFQADLDMDSLNILVVALEIEKECGLAIPWDSAPGDEIATVRDLVRFLRSQSVGATN